MPVMTGNRTDVVRSKMGHTIGFTEGQNSFVPDALVQTCLDRGHRLAANSAPGVAPKVTEEPSTAPAEKPKPRTRRGKMSQDAST